LSGVLEGTVTKRTTAVQDPTAVSDDIAGVRYDSKACDVPFSITFSLTVGPDDQFTDG
jgi:hypothetical protein